MGNYWCISLFSWVVADIKTAVSNTFAKHADAFLGGCLKKGI